MKTSIKNIMIGVACGILAGLLSILLGGCNLFKHAHLVHENKVFVRVMKHDTTVVHVDSLHRDTVIILGEDRWVDCDSINRLNGSHMVQVSGGSPMVELIFDTVYQTKEKWVENTAALQLRDASIAALQRKVDKGKHKVNSGWRLSTLLLAVLLIIFFIIKRK